MESVVLIYIFLAPNMLMKESFVRHSELHILVYKSGRYAGLNYSQACATCSKGYFLTTLEIVGQIFLEIFSL